MTSLTFSSTKRILRIKNPVSLNYFENSSNLVDVSKTSAYTGFFVESGSLTLFVNDKEYALNAENFYLLSPNTTYSFKNNDDKNAKFLTISFNCYYNVLKAVEGCNVIDENEKVFINHIVSEVKKQNLYSTNTKNAEEQRFSFGEQQLIVACIESLLVNMIRKKLANNPELLTAPDTDTIRKNCSKQIEEFLRKNVYNSISLNDVKNHLFYSKTYLNNTFKKETGCSIIAYYRMLKIEEAKKLIANGEQIVNVSEKLKFDSPSNFYKAFKSVTGMTTSQFKKHIEKLNK